MSEARGAGRNASSFWRRNALSLAALALFFAFLIGMTLTGHEEFNADQLSHGEAAVSLVVLSIFLRQRGSPESKPVAAPHAATGA